MAKPGNVRISTAARVLGISLSGVSSLKSRGRLEGEHGWVTVDSLDSYRRKLEQEGDQKNKPRSGGFITPLRYSPEERNALKKAKSYGGSSKKLNHHYIVK